MTHPNLNTAAADLIRLLTELELFGEVKETPFRKAETFALSLPEPPAQPQAFVSLRRGKYRKNHAIRELDWFITLADNRPATTEEQQALDARIDSVAALFTGTLQSGGRTENGIHWLIRRIKAKSTTGETVLHRIRLRGLAAPQKSAAVL